MREFRDSQAAAGLMDESLTDLVRKNAGYALKATEIRPEKYSLIRCRTYASQAQATITQLH